LAMPAVKSVVGAFGSHATPPTQFWPRRREAPGAGVATLTLGAAKGAGTAPTGIATSVVNTAATAPPGATRERIPFIRFLTCPFLEPAATTTTRGAQDRTLLSLCGQL